MKKILIIILSIFIVFNLTSCGKYEPSTSSYAETAKANEDAVKNLMANDTLPIITRSLERENLKRRIEFINQPDNIGYLYLLSQNGQLIKEVQILGKVSSLNSYLTPMEEIKRRYYDEKGELRYATEPIIISASDLDGTYGENQDGVFWFTPDGVYQEWTGLYLYSSERLSFTTQPLLVEEVK